MKHLLTGLSAAAFLFFGSLCMAWDGFDAETADLVEITPDRIPSPGDTINVRDHDTDTTEICLVDNVTRNRHTIEVRVRAPSGKRKTLVMESR